MPTTTTQEVPRTRKLPRGLRKANVLYKVVMASLSGVSVCLTAFSDVDPMYFQVVSILGTAFPVVWTQVLDACKQYEEEKTPTEPVSPSEDVAVVIPPEIVPPTV